MLMHKKLLVRVSAILALVVVVLFLAKGVAEYLLVNRGVEEVSDASIDAVGDVSRDATSTVESLINESGEQMADLLAALAPSAIASFDLTSLESYARVATQNPEIGFVEFLGTDNSPLIGWSAKDAADRPDAIIVRPIESEGRSFGQVKVGLTFESLTRMSARLDENKKRDLEKLLKRKTETAQNLVIGILILSVLGAVILFVSCYSLLSRSVFRPLQSLGAVMQRLASEDLDVDVVGVDRKDEIGDMAASVEVFRENAQHVRYLRNREESERARREYRQNALQEQIQGFADAVATLLDNLTSMGGKMTETSEILQSASGETHREAESAGNSADNASGNVRAVASACEQLSISIKEISQRVVTASNSTSSAVDEVRETNETVLHLADAARKIGDVVELIRDITDRTNLLALNATIEAARAGDAGKGFAVVANEVKSLASQTAKATGNIVSQIASVQSAVDGAVARTNGIAQTIENINEIASNIAGAVEEQGAATQEIETNAQAAASETSEVERNMRVVRQAADTARAVAGQVEELTGTLSTHVDGIRSRVDEFLAAIHENEDRRAFQRYDTNMSVTVQVAENTRQTHIKNVSLGGALIAEDLNARVGDEIVIRIQALGVNIAGSVIAHSDIGTHIEFNGDEANTAEAMKLVDSLTRNSVSPFAQSGSSGGGVPLESYGT